MADRKIERDPNGRVKVTGVTGTLEPHEAAAVAAELLRHAVVVADELTDGKLYADARELSEARRAVEEVAALRDERDRLIRERDELVKDRDRANEDYDVARDAIDAVREAIGLTDAEALVPAVRRVVEERDAAVAAAYGDDAE